MLAPHARTLLGDTDHPGPLAPPSGAAPLDVPGRAPERGSTRRGLLAASLVWGGLASLLAAPRARANSAADAGAEPGGTGTLGPIDLEHAVRAMRDEARIQVAAGSGNEEAYLHFVGSLLARTTNPGAQAPELGDRRIRFRTLVYHQPLLLYAIRMAPGARFELHDHRDYNGVIAVLEGSLVCRHFEWHDRTRPAADAESFLIRETSTLRLGPGGSATLAQVRDNLHEVVAGPQGALLLDAFTHHHPDARSFELEWDTDPEDAEQGLYRARWRN